jgi:hypothetical protein
LGSERIFIAHSILNENDDSCVIDNRGERFGYCVLLDRFVDADDVVVVTGCVGGVADHWRESACVAMGTNRVGCTFERAKGMLAVDLAV